MHSVAYRSLFGVVLSLLTLGGSALAQTLQPKSQPAEQQAAPPAGEEKQQAPGPSWVLTCASSTIGLDCRVGQSLFIKETGQRLLSIVLRVPPDTKKPKMLLQLPLGIYLPAGASVKFGKSAAKLLPIESCDKVGCMTEYAPSDAEVAAMIKGAELTIVIQDLKREAVPIAVPMAGFSQVYQQIR
jgi:invasion protein IalB